VQHDICKNMRLASMQPHRHKGVQARTLLLEVSLPGKCHHTCSQSTEFSAAPRQSFRLRTGLSNPTDMTPRHQCSRGGGEWLHLQQQGLLYKGPIETSERQGAGLAEVLSSCKEWHGNRFKRCGQARCATRSGRQARKHVQNKYNRWRERAQSQQQAYKQHAKGQPTQGLCC